MFKKISSKNIRPFTVALTGVVLAVVCQISPVQTIAQEQEQTPAPVVVKEVVKKAPVKRNSPRATMLSFLGAMDEKSLVLKDAMMCLDPAGQDEATWEVRAKDLVYKLKSIFDKTGLVHEWQLEIEDDAKELVWDTFKEGDVEIGRIVIGLIDEATGYTPDWPYAPVVGEWRFTQKTVNAIDAIYESKKDEKLAADVKAAGITEQLTLGMQLERQIPESLQREVVYLPIWKWIALATIFILGWPVKIITTLLITLIVGGWFRRIDADIDREVQRRAFRSTGAIVTVLIWWHIVSANYLLLPSGFLAALIPLIKLVTGVTVVWVGYRLVDILGGYIASNRELKLTHMDDVLIPLMRTVLRFVVVLVALLLIMEWMGQKPMSVLGVLGIGGVALAFAAQDTIGNFFGSITVLFDRPFGIGDWIVVDDVEGTVERVGFRSTRVRTFYNSLVTIPNSKMVNTQVDNYGARQFRRARVMLSITYDTPPEMIDAFCEGIRELIRLQPFTRKDYYHVYFNKFSESSLDILLYMFFEVPDWSTELRERHRLFIDILRLAKRMGVEFAFPTQTVWLEKQPEGQTTQNGFTIKPGEDDPEVVGHNEAARMFESVYGSTEIKRSPVTIDKKPRFKKKT